MRRIVVAPQAERDIDVILIHSEHEFGELARERYALLLTTAMADVASNPDRAGVIGRDDLARGVRTYHIVMSRNRAPRHLRVYRPRHLLPFRATEHTVEIARVLHDSMDLGLHLTD